MPLWRCPHCGTPQAEAARCWVCHRSGTACGTCRNFRASVAATLGYCGLDKRRLTLRGDEVRPCWEAGVDLSIAVVGPAPPASADARPVERSSTPEHTASKSPASRTSPIVETDRTSVRRLEFVPVGADETDLAPGGRATATGRRRPGRRRVGGTGPWATPALGPARPASPPALADAPRWSLWGDDVEG